MEIFLTDHAHFKPLPLITAVWKTVMKYYDDKQIQWWEPHALLTLTIATTQASIHPSTDTRKPVLKWKLLKSMLGNKKQKQNLAIKSLASIIYLIIVQ